MKRLVLLFGTLMLFALPAFAAEEETEISPPSAPRVDRAAGGFMLSTQGLLNSLKVSRQDLGPELENQLKDKLVPVLTTLIELSQALEIRAEEIRAIENAANTKGDLKTPQSAPQFDNPPSD